MEVVDDFLSEHSFLRLEKVLMGDDFPWFYNPGIIKVEGDRGRFMFTHQLHDNRHGSSFFFPLVEPLLERLKVKHSLWRVKANLTTKTIFHRGGNWHTDIPDEKVNTAIFYVNTNNGYTEFKKGGKVKSVANRMIIFDGDKIHTGVSCTNKRTRVVINFNYV